MYIGGFLMGHGFNRMNLERQYAEYWGRGSELCRPGEEYPCVRDEYKYQLHCVETLLDNGIMSFDHFPSTPSPEVVPEASLSGDKR